MNEKATEHQKNTLRRGMKTEACDERDLDLRTEQAEVHISVARNEAGKAFVRNIVEQFRSKAGWHPVSVDMPLDDDRIHVHFSNDDVYLVLKILGGVE